MRTGYIVSAQGHLREARALLVLAEAISEADIVQTALNRCDALRRAISRAQDLEREAQRYRKVVGKRRGFK